MELDEFTLRLVYGIVLFMLIICIVMISVIFFGPDNIFEDSLEKLIELKTEYKFDFTP
jgi:hypothetical protein